MSLLEARQKFVEHERAFKALVQSEKIAAVGRLASSMSHEINNPLEAVTNLLYLARKTSADPEVVDWLEQADRELRRVGMIANQTLRFHKQASFPRSITCLSLFSATLNLYESRLRNAGIQVETRKRANEPVECFEGDLRQALSSIITNAIDAMPNGGRLLVRSREATDWRTGRRGLALTIADTGTGMDSATSQRCFEPFFTTKDIGGLGLGLWIGQEIMARHQGALALRTRAGHGTVVSFFVPFRPSVAASPSPKVAECIVTDTPRPASVA
jgi:signal transduction histidine kinase